jgi:hypothetical protein
VGRLRKERACCVAAAAAAKFWLFTQQLHRAVLHYVFQNCQSDSICMLPHAFCVFLCPSLLVQLHPILLAKRVLHKVRLM